jgi:DNA-binding transcriptional LysR family regulator
MAEFKKRHPAVSFQIIVSDSKWIVEKVSGHELLMGVVGARLSNNRIQYTPWIDDELVAVAHPSLTKTFSMPLKDLIKFPMVVREEGSGTRREVERILDGRGIPREEVKIAGIFGSTDAIKQAVKTGLGISIVSRLSVTDELSRGILKEIRIKDTSMRRHFYIITHRKRTLPLAYTLLLQYIKTGSQSL